MNMHTRKRTKTPEVKRQCHRCHGSGLAPCRICAGRGKVMSGKDLNGMPKFINCTGCMGRKTGRCPKCNGERFVI